MTRTYRKSPTQKSRELRAKHIQRSNGFLEDDEEYQISLALNAWRKQEQKDDEHQFIQEDKAEAYWSEFEG